MKRIFIILFATAAIGVLIASLIEVKWLNMLTKPMIMSSLLFYYLYSCEPVNRSRPVVLAIVFSFAGDVLLMDGKYFIMGLFAFLIAHGLYIFGYRDHKNPESTEALRGIHRVRLAFPIILAGSGLMVILFPVLGDLKIPVLIYTMVITAMTLAALFRYGKTSSVSFWSVFGGAVLFMISDSLIAINKFLEPIEYAEFFILLSYVSAQYLIINGLLKHPHQ